MIHDQIENNTYWVKVDHKGEGLLTVNPIGLGEFTSN